MEELELDYEIKAYKKIKFQAPPELKKVHPLGKSPVVEIFKNGSSKPIVLAETGHIVSYIVRRYDFDNRLSGKNDEEEEMIDYYYHFAESSLQTYLVGLLVGNIAKRSAPWGFQLLTAKVVDAINNSYYLPNIYKSLDFLESQFDTVPGKYFIGDSLTAADIMLGFPVYDCIFNNLKLAKHLTGKETFEEDYPKLCAWSKVIGDEPSLIKGYANAKQAVDQLD